MAGRGKSNNNHVDNEQTQLLRKRLQSRHALLHESVQSDPQAEIQRIKSRLKHEGLFNKQTKVSFWQQMHNFMPTFNPIVVTAFASILLLFGLIVKSPTYMEDISGRIDQYRGLNQEKSKILFPNEIIVGNDIQIVDEPDLSVADWEADLIGADMKYQLNDTVANKKTIELHIILSKNKQNLSEAHQRSLANSPDTGEWIIVLKKRE
jgi:hypothetical protein